MFLGVMCYFYGNKDWIEKIEYLNSAGEGVKSLLVTVLSLCTETRPDGEGEIYII